MLGARSDDRVRSRSSWHRILTGTPWSGTRQPTHGEGGDRPAVANRAQTFGAASLDAEGADVEA